MNDRIIYFGRYEGWLRWLCRGVRDGDYECIKKAAELFKLMLPDECIVVPMPSHTGRPVQMLEVACNLVGESERISCVDALYSEPHMSHYDMKKNGIHPGLVSMHAYHEGLKTINESRLPVFIIDNVIGSGATAASALNVLPNATVVTLAKGRW